MAEEKEYSLRDEIYARMSERDTEDLIEIYQENDLEGRTEESLEIVRQILVERLGTLPEKEPVKEDKEATVKEEFEFPQDKVLYRIADWSSRLSVIILTVAFINAVLSLGNYFTFTLPPSDWDVFRIYDIPITFLTHVMTILYAGFLSLFLQGLTEIIYLLMDIRDLLMVTEVGEKSNA